MVRDTTAVATPGSLPSAPSTAVEQEEQCMPTTPSFATCSQPHLRPYCCKVGSTSVLKAPVRQRGTEEAPSLGSYKSTVQYTLSRLCHHPQLGLCATYYVALPPLSSWYDNLRCTASFAVLSIGFRRFTRMQSTVCFAQPPTS